MRILQVDLQNFHGFEEKRFSLSPSFSVLVGDNGTGKTGLLEALAVAAGALMVNFEDLPGRNIEPNKDCYRKATEIDGHRSTTRQFPVVVRASGVFMDKQITWARSLESGFSPEPHEEGEPQTISKLMWESRAARDLTNLPVLAYYGVGRNWPKPPTGGGDELGELSGLDRLAGYWRCLDPSVTHRLLVLMERVVPTRKLDPPSEVIKINVDTAIRVVLDSFRSLYFDPYERELMAELDENLLLPLELLPEGYRVVISMVADIALRATILNPHLGSDANSTVEGMVLIDELDLHLHPKFQRRLIEDLRAVFPRVQFIATTHSPFIVQSLWPGELVNLDPRAKPAPYKDRSLEDITEDVMGIPFPQRSERYEAMIRAATEYYETLERLPEAMPEEIAPLKRKLDELSEPFSDDPAFTAFLAYQRRRTVIAEER